ncbi:hypothetical protein ACHAXA_000028 [Cyclostephanos tholiformis]|uniref:Tetrapyrrole methylase domain-containing protein n=1 Tax=Cyclostephanos tholiformis TaxID=382380 RepID=A0ABD3SQU3_9STRA
MKSFFVFPALLFSQPVVLVANLGIKSVFMRTFPIIPPSIVVDARGAIAATTPTRSESATGFIPPPTRGRGENDRVDVGGCRRCSRRRIASPVHPFVGRINMPPARRSIIAMQLTGGDGWETERTATDETNEYLRRAIEGLVSIINPMYDPPLGGSNTQTSIVHIIGTGLSPTLMNLPLSILHILSRSDVVLYDSLGLSYEDIRRIVPNHCDLVCVGKRGDRKSWKQDDIDLLLLQKASEQQVSPSLGVMHANDGRETTTRRRCIVRLKGGDPFLFGRTRSEIDILRSNAIPYTYTPGISSCIAGPHLGGIPLTDPSLDCQSFGVWSGTDKFGKSLGLDDGSDDYLDEQWLLGVDVLVFLMIGRLDKLDALCRSIANRAKGRGKTGQWNSNTPCAVIQNAGGITEADEWTTSPVQKVWRSTLGNIVEDIKKEDSTRSSVSPAVFVVGATASLDLLSQDSQL